MPTSLTEDSFKSNKFPMGDAEQVVLRFDGSPRMITLAYRAKSDTWLCLWFDAAGHPKQRWFKTALLKPIPWLGPRPSPATEY